MTQLVGLTGGIACGKSAVSARLAARGALVVDADVIARDILSPGSLGLSQVVEHFGSSVLSEDRTLNREVLGTLIFNQPSARQTLESITHPLIAMESAKRIDIARVAKPPLIVYDAALLIEAGRHESFRPLIVVTTTQDIQRSRLMKRDLLSLQEANARLNSQWPLTKKEELADYIIWNKGSWDELDHQIDQLWSKLVGDQVI